MPASGRSTRSPRLYVRRDGTSPLVVVVGKPWTSILEPVAHRGDPDRRHHDGADRCSCSALTLFLAREIGRRAEAEDKLEELATTDALTGLKNRRKFDAEIDANGGARRATRRRSRC